MLLRHGCTTQHGGGSWLHALGEWSRWARISEADERVPHASVAMGDMYGKMDRAGKMIYIDQVPLESSPTPSTRTRVNTLGSAIRV